MEKKEKILTKENSADSALMFCPYCNSDQVWRVQRTESEMMAYALSKGEFAIKKYLCHGCRGIIVIHRDNIEYDKMKVESEENNIIHYVPCQSCGLNGLQISKVSQPDEVAYHSATGKTAFRKLTCLNCNDETIISKEDYAIGNQF